MTFSVAVRETYEDAGEEYTRFGVGVTTNNPGIGVFCPSVSENGAVAAQFGTHGKIGPQLLSYLDDGLRADETLPVVLDTFDRAPVLQVHALCQESRALHHGEELDNRLEEPAGEYGDYEGSNYSIAGNSLRNLETLDVAASAYERADRSRELAERLLDALEEGDDAGGDGRDNDARSAAIKIVDPGAGLANEWYNDLRVDASETPLADLREQYNLAKSYHDEASKKW